MHEGFSRRSRRSRSSSRTSSRGGYASPGGGNRSSRSRSPSQSRRVDKDRQEEQSLLDFMSVVTNLCSLNGLPEEPLESHKIHGFDAAVENDDQPASSYKLPIGRASADILTDIDDRVLSALSGMRSRKVSKLLQHLGVQSRKIYRF